MNKIFSADKIAQLDKFLEEARSIVITAHKSPDGDSVGSSIGLFHYLKKLGKNVIVCHPDVAPSFLHWIEGSKDILTLDNHPEQVKAFIAGADLLFCLDYNHPSRTGRMEELLVAANGKKVIVDHHRDPDAAFADILFSDIETCSTCQLIYELIEARNDLDKIDEQAGTPIYCGMVSDTGSFRFSSTKPSTHKIVADLLERGVKHWQVHENLYDTNSINKIKMVSYAMLEKLVVLPQYKTAYIWLTEEEEKRFNVIKGDTEGLVNQALGIEGIKLAGFFKESEQIVKISFRSKGQIPVNLLCKTHFEGGGHLNASGGKYVGSIKDALHKFVTNLPGFVEENKAHFE